jgi:hypothetical protein
MFNRRSRTGAAAFTVVVVRLSWAERGRTKWCCKDVTSC